MALSSQPRRHSHRDGKHSVFGQVTNGRHVVDTIKQGDKIVSIEILDDTALLTS